MSNVYGGLVSSPYNKLDTIGNFSVTHTFDGKTIDGGVEEPATIILTTFPESIGAVSGDGIFFKGSSVTVVATPDSESEYPEFDGWYEGETKISENASYTFTVSGTRTLVAKFKEATPTPALFSVFADLECTTRPTVGEAYQTLYLKFNRATTEDVYSFGDPGADPMTSLDAEWDEVDSEFGITLYVDYFGSYGSNPIPANQIIELEGPQDGLLITSNTVIDFG